MMMSRSIAVVMIICSMIVAFIISRGDVGTASHEAILNAFQTIDNDHAALQRDVLQARNGLLRNYDPIMTSVTGLLQSLGQLKTMLASGGEDETPLQGGLDPLAASILSDERLVEQFKTRNAVFQNSVSVFVRLLAELHRSPNAEVQRMIGSSSDLGNIMMRFAMDPTSQSRQQLSRELDGLHMANPARYRNLDTLVRHGRMIVDTLPDVDSTLFALLSSRTGERVHSVRNLYLVVYSERATRAAWGRLFLGSVSVLLSGYVTFLVFRLRAQTDRLKRRLNFEALTADIKREVALDDRDAGLIETALKQYAAFLRVEWFMLAIFRDAQGHSSEVYASDDRRHEELPAIKALIHELMETSQRENEPFFYRNLRRSDVIPFVHDAMSAGIGLCLKFEDGSAAVLLASFDELRPRPASDDLYLYRMCVETLTTAVRQKHADIERKALEHRLQHAQRLEAVGTLAGGIAHEFNNILGAMLGYAEMASRHMARRSASRNYVDQIVAAGARAKHIVDQILTLGRKRERVGLPFDVVETITDLMPLLRVSHSRDLDLSAVMPPSPLTIVGHPVGLQQVLINLCKNAVEASSGHATVKLTAEHVAVLRVTRLSHGVLRPGQYVAITVEDRGAGIHPNAVDRIFEPFYTTRAHEGGTGLGLAAVHGNLVDLKGVADIVSAPGNGTRFTLYFPQSQQRPLPLEEFFSERAVPIGNGELIVAIEEEAQLLAMLEDKLAALGYEPAGFSSVEAFLDAVRNEGLKPDLVVADAVSTSGHADWVSEAQAQGVFPVVYMLDPMASLDQSRAEYGQLLSKPLNSRLLADAIASRLKPHHGTARRRRDDRDA